MSVTNEEYTIQVGGQSMTLYKCHNLDFNKAVAMFQLMDDAKSNNADNVEQCVQFDQDFTIRVYIANFECHVDLFMLACLFERVNIVGALMQLERNAHKWNEEYQVGTCEYQTPCSIIHNQWSSHGQTHDIKNALNLHCDFNKLNAFGKLLICTM